MYLFGAKHLHLLDATDIPQSMLFKQLLTVHSPLQYGHVHQMELEQIRGTNTIILSMWLILGAILSRVTLTVGVDTHVGRISRICLPLSV